MRTTTPPIDFVITWVDGNDPHWKKEKAFYEKQFHQTTSEVQMDGRDVRYRDYELLRYWFRGVERYAPWVRNVHFVTWGHLPAWLDTEHPKLHIVEHKAIIPEKYLPTYNSNVIEIYLDRIEGLSEQFVYFNDDIFPMRELSPNDFFRKGLPCDMLAFQPVVANPDNPVMSHVLLNNSLVLAKYFRKRENVKQQPGKYFHPGYPLMYLGYNFLELAFPRYTGLYSIHGAYVFRKEIFHQVWERERAALENLSTHRFRQDSDLNLYLFREWQKLTGAFYPRNVERDLAYFDLADDNRRLLTQVRRPKRKMVCINDANREIDFARTKGELAAAFRAHFPERSSFEKYEGALEVIQ